MASTASWSPPPVQLAGGGHAASFDPDLFVAGGPEGFRFRHYTCVLCGHRSVTWEAFRAHRTRGAECKDSPLRPSGWWYVEQNEEHDPEAA